MAGLTLIGQLAAAESEMARASRRLAACARALRDSRLYDQAEAATDVAVAALHSAAALETALTTPARMARPAAVA